LLSVAAFGLAISTGSAMAADLPYRKEAPPVYLAPAPVATWTGFYAGLNIGGGWSSNGGNDSYLPYADTTYPIGSTPGGTATPNLFFLPGGGTTASNTGGVVGGGQIGYNYQFNSFVIGAETDFQGTSITGGHQGNYAGLYDSPYVNSNTGRVGYLLTPTLLLYGTGGFAYGGVTAFQRSNTSTGWTAGGGIEWQFAPHWSAKLEYLYVDLASSGIYGAYTGWELGNNHHPEINVVRLGVNYLFNFAPSAPVVAKY
jgi:outer membrane immunogenic protein